MKNHIYFLHGLESSGQGTKGRFLSENFPQVICPNFAGTLAERLNQLEKLCQNQHKLIFAGSSFGGLMATCYSIKYPAKVRRLILMAPALNFEEYTIPDTPLQIPTLLIIGRQDTVTPADLVIPKAEKSFANLEIRLEEDDHMLHNTFQKLDWENLLTE